MIKKLIRKLFSKKPKYEEPKNWGTIYFSTDDEGNLILEMYEKEG